MTTITKKKINGHISANRRIYNRIRGIEAIEPDRCFDFGPRNPMWFQSLREGDSVIALSALVKEVDVSEGEIGNVISIWRIPGEGGPDTDEIDRVMVEFTGSGEEVEFQTGEHEIEMEIAPFVTPNVDLILGDPL